MSTSAPPLSFYLIAKMLRNQNNSAKVDSRYHDKLMEMEWSNVCFVVNLVIPYWYLEVVWGW